MWVFVGCWQAFCYGMVQWRDCVGVSINPKLAPLIIRCLLNYVYCSCLDLIVAGGVVHRYPSCCSLALYCIFNLIGRYFKVYPIFFVPLLFVISFWFSLSPCKLAARLVDTCTLLLLWVSWRSQRGEFATCSCVLRKRVWGKVAVECWALVPHV